jgi:cytochrome c peroxidase
MAVTLVALTACSGFASLDGSLRALIVAERLTGDPSQGRDLPHIDEPLAQLGKQLFFSKALPGDRDTACASCHHPLLGGGDGLALPIGAGAVEPELLGPGRAHPSGVPTVFRNSPTTFNIGLWDQVMFHDGRLESLGKVAQQNGTDLAGIRTPDVIPGIADPRAGANLAAAQARFPIMSPAEMLGYQFAAHKPHRVIREALAARLAACRRVATFRQARLRYTNSHEQTIHNH